MATKPVKPAMAYPDFANPSFIFEPNVYPSVEGLKVRHKFHVAVGKLGSGRTIKQSSPVIEKVFKIKYISLTLNEKESFISDKGTGFFYEIVDKEFKYRHTDGHIYDVELLTQSVEATLISSNRYNLSEIELISTI